MPFSLNPLHTISLHRSNQRTTTFSEHLTDSMDPVNIVTLVGTCMPISRNATEFIVGLNGLKKRCKDVNLEASGRIAQTEAVSAATSRIGAWLQGKGHGIDHIERTSIYDSIATIEELIKNLRAGAESAAKPRGTKIFRARIAFLWENDQMDDYAIGIGHQVNALNLFLSTVAP